MMLKQSLNMVLTEERAVTTDEYIILRSYIFVTIKEEENEVEMFVKDTHSIGNKSIETGYV